MQSFQFMIHHIPGKQNVVADGLSRFMALFHHPITNDEAVGGGGSVEPDSVSELDEDNCFFFAALDTVEGEDLNDLVTKVLKACHNSRVGHFGARAPHTSAG